MILLFSILFSYFAHAQPSPDLVSYVRNSLHSGITAKEDAIPAEPCQLYHVDITGKDPVNAAFRHVHSAVYLPRDNPLTAPTVLVVPPVGGENLIDKGYAKLICSRGMRAAILESFDNDTTRDIDLGTYDRAALRTLAAAEHLLEYLRPQGKVGILGTSLGAIQSAFILGYDSRISAGVFIVGGDNLPEIITNSDEPGVAKVRQQQMAANHFRSPAEFERALEGSIRIEPSLFEDFSGPKDTAFYLATLDTTVPTKNQYDLVRAFHGSNVTLTEANHVTTVIRTFAEHAAEVVKFFHEKL